MSAGDTAPPATGGHGVILAIDTALSTAIVALAELDGRLLRADAWRAGYRHGEELLARLDALIRSTDRSLRDVRAIVVGTGPGAFTGMRVGLATAKALARSLGVPIVGVRSSDALLDAAAVAPPSSSAGAPLALELPAGPSDRVLVLDGVPRLIRGGEDLPLPAGTALVAVDLGGRAPDAAIELGRLAVDGFPAALVRLGAERLAAGQLDDVARLVPEYVTLPRGVPSVSGEVQWSRERT